MFSIQTDRSFPIQHWQHKVKAPKNISTIKELSYCSEQLLGKTFYRNF